MGWHKLIMPTLFNLKIGLKSKDFDYYSTTYMRQQQLNWKRIPFVDLQDKKITSF